MISTNGLGLAFNGVPLFEDVTVKFTKGNCYGLIGANGAGKSTFLKILSGEIDPTSGAVDIPSGQRMSVLKQDHFAYDAYTPIQTVVMGHKELFEVMTERDMLYSKTDFSDEDGLRVGELEARFGELDGYDAEAKASTLLAELGVDQTLQETKMEDLESGAKVRVLLAQALFGDPDILILDEPTNHLDFSTIAWLEDFLLDFKNLVIVVSHDRHFLNKVCTHIADLDYKKVRIYVGNYEFWKFASELSQKQAREQNKKKEDKIKELEDFIRRFSANASKSKQATSRKKLIDKLTPDELPQSSRRSPYIAFKADRPCGGRVLEVTNLTYEENGETIIDNISFVINKDEKAAFIGKNNVATSTLFQLLAGELKPTKGEILWGQTIATSYFPADNTEYFRDKKNILDWLAQFSDDDNEQYLRGFLGRMLFSGDDCYKTVNVLSGGEKVRCMLSKMMLSKANVIILDEPTNHLDLESISALNDGLMDFQEVILFSSHDHQFIETIANRIIEFSPTGKIVDKMCNFEDYLQNKDVSQRRQMLGIK